MAATSCCPGGGRRAGLAALLRGVHQDHAEPHEHNWATATVVLSDDDTDTAMFTAAGLVPGSTGSKCIEVTYSGTLATGCACTAPA